MGRIDMYLDREVPVFRKIAMGTWPNSTAASIYAQLDIDMTEPLKFMKTFGEQHQLKITPVHLVGRAMIHCFKNRPEINGMIRGSRIYRRKHIDLFFSVNVPGEGKDKTKGANLSGATVYQAENMMLADIVRQLQGRADQVKKRQDANFKASFQILKWLPWSWSRGFLSLISFLNYGLNLPLGWFGIPRDPFGSVIITNLGSLGIESAFVPLLPHSRVPMIVSIGAIKDKPVAIEGRVEVRPILFIGVTFDHRFIDGIHAAQMSRDFQECFKKPEQFFT